MRTITLPKDVRTFTRPGSNSFLYSTDDWLKCGTKVEIGEPRRMIFDHQYRQAVQCTVDGKPRWLLVDELGLQVA